ncbi:FAD-binding oxidoreductase (plasmid) [Rhizobium lusitanum]|uniref:FAD-dependent oxidoreductase n=1 Tax=Rhizobium lusitanum TaxID=293958 RepID=UPI0016160F81|nr:FAD-dependent oxidoreductase [Rhizobium lusitanum]QND46053.1 FAD-binding oxidoreductase [Rhizobium lusitanum]
MGALFRAGSQCAFERKHTLFLPGEACSARPLQTEVDARTKAGIKAELLDAATLRERHGLHRQAAVDSAISVSADPVQLTASLLRNAKIHGTESLILSALHETFVISARCCGGPAAAQPAHGR